MILKISNPESNCTDALGSIGKKGYIYPAAGEANSTNRMFIICEVKRHSDINEVATSAMYHAVCDTIKANYDTTKSFDEEIFNEALHSAYDVLDSVNEVGEPIRRGDATLAFVILHHGGCFLATTGSAQVMLVRPGVGIIFRSRNITQQVHLGDEMGQLNHLKASTTNIDSLQPGDYIYMSNDRPGIMADDEIANALSGQNENALQRLKLATVSGNNRMEYLIHITDVQQEDAANPTIPDVVSKKTLRHGPTMIAITTALLAVWFMLVFAIASYIIDRLDL